MTRCLLICSAFSMLLLAGCNDGTTGLVTGTVKVDGELPAYGQISFTPADNKGTPVGTQITDGKYSAQVPFGEKRVEIRVPKEVGRRRLYDTPDSPMEPVMAEGLPAKYHNRSELTIVVEKGENVHDYDLEGLPSKKK